jgi:hypothetical protein
MDPTVWEGDGRFDLRTAESHGQMEAFLRGKQAARETSRISAGYCWPWSDPRPDDTLVPDVRIGSWLRPWNVRSERSVGPAPGSAFWATDPKWVRPGWLRVDGAGLRVRVVWCHHLAALVRPRVPIETVYAASGF